MTRRLLLATCLLASAASWIAAPPRPALADEPKVVLKGAKTAPVGGAVMIDARDSKSDADQPLQWSAVEPEDLAIGTFDQKSREAVVGIVTLPRAGRYVIAVTAIGSVDKRLKAHTRLWTVTADGAVPTPEPPPPAPGPTPNPTPTPGPDTPMAKVARDFANGVLEAYATSWEVNATVLASGQPPAAAFDAGNKKLLDLRLDSYRKTFRPVLNAVLPEGAEVRDQAQRDAVTRLERDFAAALRGLKR